MCPVWTSSKVANKKALKPFQCSPKEEFQSIQWTVAFFSGVPIFEPVGCFLDSGTSPRPMPLLLRDFRPEMNWNNIDAVIEQCAGLTHNKSLM